MREREREREIAYQLYHSPSTVNPDVIIQSEVQYVLAGNSTTLEARVFASPLNQAVVKWYHRGRLIDDATESSYTATSVGDSYRLTVHGVSENEVGEYTIVVTLAGRNATDRITLSHPGTCIATHPRFSITKITRLPQSCHQVVTTMHVTL